MILCVAGVTGLIVLLFYSFIPRIVRFMAVPAAVGLAYVVSRNWR